MFHPIFFRFMLIILSLLIRVIVFKFNISWFFFLIILVFLGGVMILIIYINTLAINEKFFFMKKNFSFIVFLSLFLLFILVGKNRFIKINYRNSIAILIYDTMNFYIMIFLILYLLVTLICVVKLIKFEYGPLIKRL
jgi:hypothetical protein